MKNIMAVTILASLFAASLLFTGVTEAAFAVSDAFKNIQDVWSEEYTAEFPAGETTLPQSPAISSQELQYKYPAETQRHIFTALLAINAQSGNTATQTALTAAGYKQENSQSPLVAIYSKQNGKNLQVVIAFRNIPPDNPAQFVADCGNPVRYMNFDDSVHNYFSSATEPAMRDAKLYSLCQLAKEDKNVKIIFCGTQFGGGFALIGAAIASLNFALAPEQVEAIQFSAPSIAGKGFINAFNGKFTAINFVRPNDPAALMLNSLKFYPFGDITTVNCSYNNLLDFGSLYRTVAGSACANYISDIWDTEHSGCKYDKNWFATAPATIAAKANTENINVQQYLFLGSLTSAAAYAAYDENFNFAFKHLGQHKFKLTRYNGAELRITPESVSPVPAFSAVYSKRLDTDGREYYIIGIAADPLALLKRWNSNFIVESQQFGKLLKPIADDLNTFTSDKDFSDFVTALNNNKTARILVTGYGAGGSYASYLAAFIAASPGMEPKRVRLLTLGDLAAIDPKMQLVLDEKVHAIRVTNLTDGIPDLGELFGGSKLSTSPFFMPQNGEYCGITTGFVTDYTYKAHNLETYIGIALKSCKNYIARWNDEAWLAKNAAKTSIARLEGKQKAPVQAERMICVTSACEPW